MTNNHLLIRALRLNATFSGASALFLLAAGPWVAAQLGLASTMPVYVTAGLLAVFALQLGNIVRTKEIRSLEITAIILGDFAWVAGSAVLVALFYPSLTTMGLLLVNLVAIAVLFLAIQQIRGLRALRRDAAT
jgi:membrane associated rhomboid family serine protease